MEGRSPAGESEAGFGVWVISITVDVGEGCVGSPVTGNTSPVWAASAEDVEGNVRQPTETGSRTVSANKVRKLHNHRGRNKDSFLFLRVWSKKHLEEDL